MNMLNRFTTYTRKSKEVTTGIFTQNLFCNINNTNYVQNLWTNNTVMQLRANYFIALSIIFLIVQKRQTRSLNTIISGVRKTGFYYFVYKEPQNKKKHYQIWKIKLSLSSHRLVYFNEQTLQWVPSTALSKHLAKPTIMIFLHFVAFYWYLLTRPEILYSFLRFIQD